MQFRYLGQPVSNWYGLDLLNGQVVTLPDHLVAKAEASPMFAKLEKAAEKAPEEAEPDDKPRRGRPRKAQE